MPSCCVILGGPLPSLASLVTSSKKPDVGSAPGPNRPQSVRLRVWGLLGQVIWPETPLLRRARRGPRRGSEGHVCLT